MATPIDDLDRRLVEDLAATQGRGGVSEMARRLGVARGTVQARFDKLLRGGVLRMGPDIDPEAIGYSFLAFVSISFAQGRRPEVLAHLARMPEVLEAQTITGRSDLLCRVVARTHTHLQDVLDRILDVRGIDRTETVIALQAEIPYRTVPLMGAAVAARGT